MTDIAVVILTKNEKLHIARCLERLRDLNPRQVFVVDCFSTDGTHAIVENVKCRIENGKWGECSPEVCFVEHEWPGNQAKQFNWALDNLPIKASWVLRLDADEYLYPDTIAEINALLPKWDGKKVTGGSLPPDVTSLSLSLSRRIFGGDIRHGNPEIELVRLFKFGFGRSTDAEMDEHIVTSEGRNLRLNGQFVDDSLLPFVEWQEKHRGYAKREAKMAVEGRANKNKRLYYKFPPYFRAFAYFCIRYFLKLGFLDGLPGFRWHFWQGLWYRCLVDREIGMLKCQRNNANNV